MNFDVSVIIVAGGVGTRMQSDIPKQFLEIEQKPIFIYSIARVLSAFNEAQVILVLPVSHLEAAKKMVANYLPDHSIEFCTGGNTRYDSVANGLQLVRNHVVMVHDAVRPFINETLLHQL